MNIKRITALLVFIILFLAGCVTIKYGEFEYNRLGGQKIDNLIIAVDPNGVTTVSLGKQESENLEPNIKALTNLVNSLK